MYVYKIASTNPLENLAIEEVCFKYWDQSDPFYYYGKMMILSSLVNIKIHMKKSICLL